MDYLEYFGLTAEPFSHAPVSRFYYASRQHTDALKRLLYASQNMKGLAILVGDIGHGKTTLARRLLDALPASEFEAAMLVIVHAGVTANWLLKRIAMQLGVPSPADDKLSILSQLYDRLVEVHESGRRAVVLIDEAQMLATRELMEEFRGLLNLEVPGHKLVSFVFFGLPEIERNLQLDPALAQRVALRYHLKPLGIDETRAYVQHRLRLADAKDELFPPEALDEVHRVTRGVPRLINTLCDNVLLELFFEKQSAATTALVSVVAQNLGLGARDAEPLTKPAIPPEDLAVPGSAGEDAVVAVTRETRDEPAPRASEAVPRVPEPAPRTPEPAGKVPVTFAAAEEAGGGNELEMAVRRVAAAPAPAEDFDASFAAAFDHAPEPRRAVMPSLPPRDVASIQPKLVVPAPVAEPASVAAPTVVTEPMAENAGDYEEVEVDHDAEKPETVAPAAQASRRAPSPPPAPAPAPPPTTKATPAAGTKAPSDGVKTTAGTVDLDAIDDLLLELQRL
jgi:general secretion pathway protein A